MAMLRTFVIMLLAAIAVAGCARGPDEAQLADDLQARLDGFASGLFELAWLRRAGSAPEASVNGEEAAILYFDAELTLTRDYDLAAWDSPGIAALADLLGAAEHGLFGIARDGNATGDSLQVHGSMRYRLSDGTWAPLAYVGAEEEMAPGPFDNVAAPSRAVALLDQIGAMMQDPDLDLTGPEGTVVASELEAAWWNIQQRLERINALYVVASGPLSGEYWQLARAYVRFLNRRGIRVANRVTNGSVENARVLASGEADVALIQSDVAGQAYRGEGPFAGDGPMEDLRALATLYPEPVHVVVLAESGIDTVADMMGRRVDIGPLGSGTRGNALAILGAHGLDDSNLAGVEGRALPEALSALARGETDAVFATIGVSASVIRDFMATHDARLVALDTAIAEAVAAELPGLLVYAIPRGSYHRQDAPVQTVTATALMVALKSMPDAEVAALLTATFEEMNFLNLGSLQGTRISVSHAREGIDIPLHAGAAAYFDQ